MTTQSIKTEIRTHAGKLLGSAWMTKRSRFAHVVVEAGLTDDERATVATRVATVEAEEASQ